MNTKLILERFKKIGDGIGGKGYSIEKKPKHKIGIESFDTNLVRSFNYVLFCGVYAANKN